MSVQDKINKEGKVHKYKARRVAKDYKQRHGVDYDKVFAPIARINTASLLTKIAAQSKWKVYQMNVKSTFLNGFVEKKEFTLSNHMDIKKQGLEDKVYRLKKPLYGFKQVSRA